MLYGVAEFLNDFEFRRYGALPIAFQCGVRVFLSLSCSAVTYNSSLPALAAFAL